MERTEREMGVGGGERGERETSSGGWGERGGAGREGKEWGERGGS